MQITDMLHLLAPHLIQLHLILQFPVCFFKILLSGGTNYWLFPYRLFSNESIIWTWRMLIFRENISVPGTDLGKYGFKLGWDKFWKASFVDWFWEVYLIYSLVLCILREDSTLQNACSQLPCSELVKGVHLYTAEKECNESERDVFYAVSTFSHPFLHHYIYAEMVHLFSS